VSQLGTMFLPMANGPQMLLRQSTWPSSFSDSQTQCAATVFAGACNMLDPSDITSNIDNDKCRRI